MPDVEFSHPSGRTTRLRDLGGGVFAPEVAAVTPPGSALATVAGAPAASNVRNGFQSFTTTAAATTLVTVPAGRTWQGTLSVACAAVTAAAVTTAGSARAVVSVAGVGAVPAAGTVLACEARAAANAATGTAGNAAANSVSCPLVVAAPDGNNVTVQVATTITTGVVDVTASGSLV